MKKTITFAILTIALFIAMSVAAFSEATQPAVAGIATVANLTSGNARAYVITIDGEIVTRHTSSSLKGTNEFTSRKYELAVMAMPNETSITVIYKGETVVVEAGETKTLGGTALTASPASIDAVAQQQVASTAQSANNTSTPNGVSVVLSGKAVNFTGQKPIIQNGRTLVPVRGVFEQLGFTVAWDNNTSTATLKSEYDVISIPLGKASFTANGKTITPDVPAQIIGGSTMLPLRAICESIGSEVNWNNASQTATIEYKGSSSAGTQNQISTPTNPDKLSYLPRVNTVHEFSHEGVRTVFLTSN